MSHLLIKDHLSVSANLFGSKRGPLFPGLTVHLSPKKHQLIYINQRILHMARTSFLSTLSECYVWNEK